MLTADVSAYVKYVNTFACQKYLHKIASCTLHICVRLSEMDMWHTQMY